MAREHAPRSAAPDKPADDAVGPVDETSPLVMDKVARPEDELIVREESKSILALAGAMIGADAVEALPAIAMGLLLGNVSSTDSATILAGSSLSSFFQAQVTMAVMGGIGPALETLGAQSFGAQQLEQLCLYAQAAVLGYAYCLPVCLLLSLNGASLYTLMGQDPAIANVAAVLMRIDTVSLPLVYAASIARCMLTAQRIVAPLVIVPFASYAVSLPLAYILGYHTSLGYVGIQLASLVNNAIKTAILVPLAWKSPAFRDAWPGWQWREAHDLVVRTWPLAVASACMGIFQSLGLNIISILCGYLPDTAHSMASSSIADSLFSLAVIPLVGTYSGGAIVVGNALGANQARRAAIGSTLSTGFTVLSAVVSVIVCLCVASSFARASTSDSATAAAAVTLWDTVFLSVPLVGWMFGMQGVLCACGKQWFVATMSLVFLCILSAPLAYALGVTWGFGAAGVWGGQMLGMLSHNIVMTVYILRLDWRSVASDAFENTHIHMRKRSVA